MAKTDKAATAADTTPETGTDQTQTGDAGDQAPATAADAAANGETGSSGQTVAGPDQADQDDDVSAYQAPSAPPANVAFGNPDAWKLIHRIEYPDGPAEVTMAMQVQGAGTLVRFATQDRYGMGLTALQFLPGVKIDEQKDEHGNVTCRHLVAGH